MEASAGRSGHPTQIIAIQPEQVERIAERISTTMAQQFEERVAALIVKADVG